MQKQHKDLLRTLVAGLRHILLGRHDDAGVFQPGDLDRELERLGIGRDGSITPLDALPNATPAERRAHRVAEAQLAGVPEIQRPAVRQEIVERAAYTWINRLLAVRAMEARGLTDETLRPNPAYDGIPEALFILRHTDPHRTAGADGGWWAVIEDACRAQAASLPGLFDLDDPNAALRPSTAALVRCVGLVGGGNRDQRSEVRGQRSEGQNGDPASNGLDDVFRDPDAIGWAYQFYQEEAKARTYAKLGRGGKVETRAEIAAVTQLFTEPYMVQWLLQNSLGRSYHELYPDSRLPETWAYYIQRSEDQRSEGQKSEGQATDHRSPITDHRSPFTSLADLTFMDPCMGSGHFEREAFDMLAAMYREQQPEMDAAAVADRILSHHLHGIDIDPRAAQLAALTLYLRAWEYVKQNTAPPPLTIDNSPLTIDHFPIPHSLNLATTPTHLTPGALQRHLQRHPEDRPFEPLLRGVFEALEQAPILGSLLKPGEHLDQVLATYRKPHSGVQMGLLDESASLNRLLEELARHDPDELKRVLLERISRSFSTEAGNADDVGAALFGREAGEGMRLLQLLEGKYAVVATNPPYMGDDNMSEVLRTYVALHYRDGRSDLSAAFIMRGLELCKDNGRLAMVPPQSWMFLKSYASLRASHGELPSGLLQTTCVEALAQLGRYAFSEIDVPVGSVLLVTRKASPSTSHRIWAIRLVEARPSLEQAAMLAEAAYETQENQRISKPRQLAILSIPKAPLVYWLSDTLIGILSDNRHVTAVAVVGEGLSTSENRRHIRFSWEVPASDGRWIKLAKGGQFQKWAGLEHSVVDWAQDGLRVKQALAERYPYLKGNVGFKVKDEAHYLSTALTYTTMARGSLGIRFVKDAIFENSGSFIVPYHAEDRDWLAGVLNARLSSFLLRSFTQSRTFKYTYMQRFVLPGERNRAALSEISACAHLLVSKVVATCLTEASFTGVLDQIDLHVLTVFRLSTEATQEHLVFDAYELDNLSRDFVASETGLQSGWHPLILGLDALPTLPSELDLPPLPQEVLDYLAAHERIHPDPAELARIKANLRTLYEAGPGARTEDTDLEELEHQGDEDEAVSGAYIPIPTETFLEELSVKLHIHPISVYQLLDELRAEGVRCKPEERRLLEDRLSVLALRLLGHRWPRQLEAGEPVPPWADQDGIIPLTPGCGEPTVADRLRERLRAEDGPLGAQRVEALLEELTNQTLEVWLRKTFFERHTRQFKRRPIAWHLASTALAGGRGKAGKQGKKGRREPAFECLLYYHACGGDVLARIRTQYVEPLLLAERRRVDQARKAGDDSAAALATARIHELEDFAQRLRQVEESGFACDALDDFVAGEPLDRWSGDGVFPPAGREALLAQERAWRVDINDGVRVNVAPLQAAGLLAGDVLNKKDLPKALADRARWRSDERRWVRAGKLPRCGWMDDSVPESPAWTDLAPEREAERVRLEEKRKAALGQTSA